MLKKEIPALRMEDGRYLVTRKIIVGFDSDEDGETMSIRIGDEVIAFRFEEVQEMIRQERMRHG